MEILRIKNWNRIFETSESRKLKKLSFVLIPNKWDGLGFSRLKKHPEFVTAFAGWVLLAQIASKMPVRGVFVTEAGEALTIDDMADITGVDAEIFHIAIGVLTDPKIGWLERVKMANLPESPDVPGFSPDVPGEMPEKEAILAPNLPQSPDASGKSPALKEQNRIEQNRMKYKENNSLTRIKESAQNFNPVCNPPKIEDVKKVAEGFGISFGVAEAQEFLDWHTARGWELRGSKIHDWRPRVRAWKERGREMAAKDAPKKLAPARRLTL